jgi:dihydrofolate reductase/thymidylate synthase
MINTYHNISFIMQFSLIVAVDKNNGISKDGRIPWNIKEDLNFFQDVTKQSANSALILGRNTWNSLEAPLKDRITIIVSSTLVISEMIPNVYLVPTIKMAITKCHELNVTKVFICGGRDIYNEAYDTIPLDEMYITKIDHDYDCDNYVTFPGVEKYNIAFEHTFVLNGHNVTFTKYSAPTHSNPEEQNYLNLLKNAFLSPPRQTRNGITMSLFGAHLEFDLSKSFPLLTTKKMFLKGIFEELLFFLKGETNSKLLTDKGVKIWEGNTTKEFLNAQGLNYEEGDMGPLYGFQLRHFNAEYHGCHSDYEGQGLDQIEYCLNLIKTDPFSRRIIMTTFNPAQAKQGCLFPCHSLVLQFYVSADYKLSMTCYNRSQDMFLGVPFNICSAALLVHMFCHVINNTYEGPKLSPGRLIMNLGDVHVYQEHSTQAIRQILRTPYEFPRLQFKRAVSNLTDFCFEDLEIIGYQSYPGIIAKMVA